MSKWQGAGEISIAKRNATTGLPTTPFLFLGCVDSFNPKFSVEFGAQHYERCSGLGLPDYQGIKSRSGTLDLTFTEWNVANIAKMLNGTIVAAGSPGTVTDETFPTSLVVGDVWHLGAGSGETRHKITTPVLTGTGSPTQTLSAGTHYEIDTDFGTVEILSVSGYTQPIHASYGYTDGQAVSIFTASDDEYIVRYNALNVADSSSKHIVELYCAKINPVSDLPLITDDFATFAMSMRLFADQKARSSSSTYGQFGRVVPDLT